MTEYLKHPPQDPFIIFDNWYKHAQDTEGRQAHVMYLASVNYLGQPSVRAMMLHSISNKAFLFFTNLNSRKSIEILDNPHVAICFYWPSSNRHVRIEGVSTKVPDQMADKVFQLRPIEHQMNIVASEQSKVMHDAHDLELSIAQVAHQYGDDPIERPAKWGGY
ncbi:MAG: pyridoxal 5'-phosphate synthase, partial [Alphaproteobacteria bacterium]|nr:pyridoxal 5'-phosphate synthase [Alphaproteobacteria bacterium]